MPRKLENNTNNLQYTWCLTSHRRISMATCSILTKTEVRLDLIALWVFSKKRTFVASNINCCYFKSENFTVGKRHGSIRWSLPRDSYRPSYEVGSHLSLVQIFVNNLQRKSWCSNEYCSVWRGNCLLSNKLRLFGWNNVFFFQVKEGISSLLLSHDTKCTSVLSPPMLFSICRKIANFLWKKNLNFSKAVMFWNSRYRF